MISLAWTCQAQHYVNVAGTNPIYPYSDWTTAATNIQDAIDASVAGDQVFVTNGVYQFGGRIVYGSSSNRVAITQPITVASINGPAVTVIQGNQLGNVLTGDGAVRCVYMTNGAVLTGFTLTEGATRRAGDLNQEQSGGGLWCESAGSTISNCVITGNAAWYQGGGAYQGMLLNCVLSANLVSSNQSCYGGAAFQSALTQCTVTGNSNQGQMHAFGGGLCNGTATNCLISLNTCSAKSAYGGGLYTVNAANCIISSNNCNGSLAYGGGSFGGVIGGSALIANSCNRYSNVGQSFGGGVCDGTIANCTIVNNCAWTAGGGAYGATEMNCINYFNNCPNPPANACLVSASYCCSVPLPTGTGCITNDPLFSGAFHLSTNSPCRGAGTTLKGSLLFPTDIDGEPWANPPSMGCDEIYPGSVLGNFSVSIAPAFTNLAPGFPGNFQANISGPTSASVWNFGDGTLVTNEAFVSHAWATNGDYVITLTGYNDTYPAGQTTTLTVHVSVPGVYYVDLNSLYPIAPYSYWDTAATNIQDAVDAAVPGSLVLVTNGNTLAFPGTTLGPTSNGVAFYQFGGRSVYGISNRVAVTKPITVASVTGPQSTMIMGAMGSLRARGVYLTNGATLIGFTVTNASAMAGDPVTGESGGGIWCESTNTVITNCTITGCFAYYGGGVYSGTLFNCLLFSDGSPAGTCQYGGGADAASLYDCTLFANRAQSGGGAANSSLSNCTISNNYGGGTYLCGLTDCMLIANFSAYGGGAQGGGLTNCTLVGNVATVYGGGAYGTATTAIVLNNCLIVSNSAAQFGGGVSGPWGPNASYCVLNNCTLVSNTTTLYGGGAAYATVNNCQISNNVVTAAIGTGGGIAGGMANGCTIIGNQASTGAGVTGLNGPNVFTNCILAGNIAFNGSGGGAVEATLYNCTLSNNVATNHPGGAANSCILSNCIISGNVASSSPGGGGASYSTLYNCLVVSNVALGLYNNPMLYGTGAGTLDSSLFNCILAYNVAQGNGGGDASSTLVNCTVVSNSAPAGGGVFNSTVENSIVFDNAGGNYYFSAGLPRGMYYCCTTPLTSGPGIVTNDPAFVNFAGGDFHLQSASPCINSGDNLFVTSATDFDGNPRIVGGTVDLGAYEYQTPSSILSYAWAQQYGLPTDGSVDYLDLDGTGIPNWQKSIAGLNPTNAASVLAMLPLATTNISTNGVTVSWQSVATRTYYLLRAADLSARPPFSTIQSNLVGQAGATIFTDTSATNGSSYFYRVGVQ
jgi:hypothetical protein